MPFVPVRVENEYEKDKNLKRDDVKALLEWAEKQPHLPDTTELQAILFLQSCYYSIEAAKRTLDTFFTVRSLCPDLFSISLNDNLLQTTLRSLLPAVLPKKTPEGHTVVLLKEIDCNPDVYHLGSQLKVFDMVTLLDLNLHGTSNGCYIVLDMEGGVLGHLTKVIAGITSCKKFLYYLEEAMPIRLKGIHVINAVPFIDKLMGMIKPLMKNDLFGLMHVHSHSIETLFEFIPKECLPEEYGGEAPSIATLHEQANRAILDNFDFFELLQKQRVDETRRPGKPKSAGDLFGIGVEGSFKKLEVD